MVVRFGGLCWRFRTKLDFVHLGGVGDDVGELNVYCGWGFQLSSFNPDS